MLYWSTVAASFILVVTVIMLIRRGSLSEQHGLGWLGVSVAIAALALVPGVLDGLASLFGVKDAPNLLFGAAFYGLILIVLRLQTQLSQLSRRERTLAQELAVTRLELEQLRDSGRPRDAN